MYASARVNRRIRRYLRQVRRHLKDRPASERDEVLRSVEEHIREALAKSVQGEPTLEDLEAVLASMDSPQSYAAAKGDSASPRDDREVLGWWALSVMIAGAAAFLLAWVLGSFIRGSIGQVMLLVGGVLGVTAVILGAIAWRTTKGKIAIAGGIVIILVALYLIPVQRQVTYETGEDQHQPIETIRSTD